MPFYVSFNERPFGVMETEGLPLVAEAPAVLSQGDMLGGQLPPPCQPPWKGIMGGL